MSCPCKDIYAKCYGAIIYIDIMNCPCKDVHAECYGSMSLSFHKSMSKYYVKMFMQSVMELLSILI